MFLPPSRGLISIDIKIIDLESIRLSVEGKSRPTVEEFAIFPRRTGPLVRGSAADRHIDTLGLAK